MRYSREHEREEARLLRKAHARTWAGLILCWLPVIGLLFAAGGFLRTLVRVTKKHRKRRRGYLVFASIVLALAIGANLAGLWVYSRDPEILSRLGDTVWRFVVGEDVVESRGTEYPDMDSAGLGVTGTSDDGTAEDDADFLEWDDGFDWDSWEDTAEDPTGDDWVDASDADWFFDDTWVFDEDDLQWGDDGWDGDGLVWGDDDTPDDALFDDSLFVDDFFPDAAGDAEDAPADGLLHVGKGETILPADD